MGNKIVIAAQKVMAVGIINNQEPAPHAFMAQGLLYKLLHVCFVVVDPVYPQQLTDHSIRVSEADGIRCRNPKDGAVRIFLADAKGNF
ncbi:hypothetical protein VTN49DRAFT_906 [Thermomyces lanuginosus]|uniref:uncharacterized protein n=1 Tax=Thermomyces lanuginosus TaxID=5541 RepID=UPI003742E600